MIREANFWTTEAEAPLLDRNNGFVTRNSADKLCQRAQLWVDLATRKGENEIPAWQTSCPDEASQRIFTLDAERTFKSPENRQSLIETLATIYSETQDYHQGMGFIVAFLLLFLKKEEVAKIVINLHKEYIPGYFKAAPVAYVRDAKTFERVLQTFFPEVHQLVTRLIPAEAYCSKCFLTHGGDYHFQYAMALIKNTEKDILATRDVARVLAILRLDSSVYPNTTKTDASEAAPGSFFAKIVEDADVFELGNIDLSAIRDEVMLEMAETERKRIELDALLDADYEEIVFSDEEDSCHNSDA